MSSRIQRELAFLLTGRDVSATRAMSKVERKISGLERHSGKAFRNMGRNLEHGIAVGAFAAGGAVAYAVKQAIDWQTAWTGVLKTLDATPAELAEIEAGIRAMSRRMPISAVELAGIAEAAGALGVRKKDILGFTETVALLSVTTNLTSEGAATSLGHLRTTLNLTGEDFEALGDAIVHLGNNGASTEAEIVSMAENIAGAAQTVGATPEQVVAWASAMASAGEQAEAGGSSIQRFWLQSFKSVHEGGKRLQLMAKILGQTPAQFKKAYGQDSTGTLATLIEKMGELSKAEQLASLEALGFTDIRVQRALLKLLGNTDNLRGALEDVGEAEGAMSEEAEKRFKDTAVQLEILENNVKDAAITIGSKLLPIINELAGEGVAWITSHQAEIEQFGDALADGIRDAVTWAKSLDWDAITASLQAGAGAAKLLIDAFLGAPPWLQQFLMTGFVANKFTGGVIGDVVGDIVGAALKAKLGLLAIQAGVVNVNGAVAGGAGAGGVVPGSGKPTSTLGKAFDLVSKLVIVGFVAELAQGLDPVLDDVAKELHQGLGIDDFWKSLGVPEIRPQDISWPFGPKDTPTILPDVFGGNGLLGGRPEGAPEPGDKPLHNRGTVDRDSYVGKELLAKILTLAERKKAAREAGNDEKVERIKVRIMGLREALGEANENADTPNHGPKFIANRERESIQAFRDAERASRNGFEQTSTDLGRVHDAEERSLVAFREGERSTASGLDNVKSATVSGAATGALATSMGASRVVGAITANRPIVTTDVKVFVTGASVKTEVVKNERLGPGAGSAGGGDGAGAGLWG